MSSVLWRRDEDYLRGKSSTSHQTAGQHGDTDTGRGSVMPSGLHHIAIVVKDMKATVEFYEKVRTEPSCSVGAFICRLHRCSSRPWAANSGPSSRCTGSHRSEANLSKCLNNTLSCPCHVDRNRRSTVSWRWGTAPKSRSSS